MHGMVCSGTLVQPRGHQLREDLGGRRPTSDTLTDRASEGTSKVSINTSSLSWRSATASAPTRWATRSTLDRE